MADALKISNQQNFLPDVESLARDMRVLQRRLFEVVNEHALRTTHESGTVAPTSTPTFVGQMYVDTTANKGYIATGTSSSSDWTILN